MKWPQMLMNRNAIQHLQNAYGTAIDWLYPRRCPLCDEVIKYDTQVCHTCRYDAKYIVQPYCMKCGKKLDYEGEYCYDCMNKKHSYVRCVATFAYTDKLKKSMYRFKYGNRREYAVYYAENICRLRGDIIRSWQPDLIIPVPLHEKRYAKRGYNQAGLVAVELGKGMNIPVDETSLIRCKNTIAQKMLNDKQRGKNLNNAFQITSDIVKYKKIVLIDDIYTTGATLDACAQVLMEAGVHSVYCVVVCVGQGI